MSRVVLAAADEDLILRVKQAADGDVHVLPPGRLPGDPARLFEQLLDGELPDVLVIGPGASPDAVLTLAARLDIQTPGISVVLITEASQQMWQAAMRSGIRDLLPPSANVPEIRDALERASVAANGRRRVLRPVTETERYTGRVITIASPKGGVGKTTVSTNLAIGLTAAAPQSTVLVDLDVQFGDVASALSLVPEYTLPDVVRGAGQRGHDGPQDLPHPAPERALRRLRRGVPGRRRHRHAATTSPGCSRCWRGSSATSSSTPHRGCRSRRWPPSTGPPTS